MPKDQFGRPAPPMNPRPAPGTGMGFGLPNGSQFPGQGNAYGLVKAPGVTPITTPPQNHAKPETSIPFTPALPQVSTPYTPPPIDAMKSGPTTGGGGYAAPQAPIFGSLPPGSRFNDALRAMSPTTGGLFSPTQGK